MSQPDDYIPPSPDVTGRVQDFYDRYPYPPPVESLDQYRRAWQDQRKRRADYHLFWPNRSYREDYSVLVAGSGTSQAAKHAMRWPKAQVTGIDLSATSVRCTEELKRKYDLSNLHVYQLPIDRVTDLKTTFDQIVCTGVLHHLADPDAGLAALRDVLKPDGAMHLMVYAPYGRTGIYMLQEFCRRVGIPATDEGIADLIAALRALPKGHPLETLLREAPDFQHEAALADALLHPQDRAYSVPQLFDFIKRAGLTFGRWVKQAPYSARCGVMARLPQSLRLMELTPAEQFAAIELFRGTMVRHSVVVHRNDRPNPVAPISFAGEAWMSYVPIRMTETICVQERLPAGAAGVLINQNHTYTDLFMPIDATEKRMFDAIDGARSIGDILQATLPHSPGQRSPDALAFFERLWWHDQVVFDASRS
jgi:SAM-dependent methyltransferase